MRGDWDEPGQLKKRVQDVNGDKQEYKPEETYEGVRLVRIHNDFLMRTLPNDLFRNPLWWRRAYKQGLKLYKDGFDFKVVHCHDLDALKPGVRLKKKLGVKVIFDGHEVFGQMIENDVPKIVSKYA